MGATCRIALFILTTAALGTISVAQRPQAPVRDEYFGVGDKPLHNIVPLSPAVAKLLLQTEEAKDRLRDYPGPQKKWKPAEMFQAQEVRLSRSDKHDLVVSGRGPMMGADNVWFWIVRDPDTDPQVIGFMNGHSIGIMGSNTNGFRDITSSWSSPSDTHTQIFHFNGRKYQLWKDTWTENHN